MFHVQVQRPACHLRLLFQSAVVSRRLRANATLGDVARVLDDLAGHEYGPPVDIQLQLKNI